PAIGTKQKTNRRTGSKTNRRSGSRIGTIHFCTGPVFRCQKTLPALTGQVLRFSASTAFILILFHLPICLQCFIQAACEWGCRRWWNSSNNSRNRPFAKDCFAPSSICRGL